MVRRCLCRSVAVEAGKILNAKAIRQIRQVGQELGSQSESSAGSHVVKETGREYRSNHTRWKPYLFARALDIFSKDLL